MRVPLPAATMMAEFMRRSLKSKLKGEKLERRAPPRPICRFDPRRWSALPNWPPIQNFQLHGAIAVELVDLRREGQIEFSTGAQFLRFKLQRRICRSRLCRMVTGD